ncbi:fibronectin type III domain-containing protein [Streptomyces bambusae]|uniref:fibronectin type III domain-containing protein n=1 Tax=Streptomyces bambusae TaxID=1550616 RepID=UPI001CFE29D9|nr:fibronectin type III domain-containing protein [Streptomyces bambusae]MCB5168242.1 fibronectin type III domain-containing protein [Streptomyces bambusae]
MRRPVGTAVLVCGLGALLAGCAGTAPDTQSPPAPAGLTAQAGSSGSVHVMWEDADPADGVTGYQVFRGAALVRELPAGKRMVDITGLAPLTAYGFSVRAKDASGNLSPRSAEARVTTPAATPDDHRPPGAPARLTGRPDGPRTAVLEWRAGTDDTGVSAYDVYQGGVRIHTVDGRTTRTRLTGLRPDTAYTFTVRARDRADNSSPDSPAADVTTPPGADDGRSTVPADFRAEAAPGAVALSWYAPDTGRPVTEYELYVNGRAATVVQWGRGAVPAGRASYRLTVAEPDGTVWRLKLRARLPDGSWGSFSVERSVTLAGP